MKKDHKPIPYAIRKTENGRKEIVKIKDKAEVAATHLENIFWGKTDENPENGPEVFPGKIVNENLKYRIEKLTLEELREIIKKTKRRKATGPDEIPMEAFKEMDDESLQKIIDLLNEWWENENIPEETLEARVVLIF